MTKQFVTAGYLSTQLQAPIGKVLQALRRAGAEPALILNETVYWDGDQAAVVRLALSIGREDLLGAEPPEATANG